MPGEQVVERQHRVRLAAAEVGLELHDRVAALAGEAPHRADQHPLEALGEVGAAEELDRVPVLVRPLAEVHLPEVGGELGLLVAAAGHVLVRRHHLAPGLEAARRRALDRRAGALALLAAHLLVEAQAQQLHLHLLDLVGLRRRDGGQQPAGRVERAVGVVAGEGLLVRPAVALVAQLADEAALGGPERLAEDVVPGLPHELEQRRHVPCRRSASSRSGDPRPGSGWTSAAARSLYVLLNSRSTKGPSPPLRSSIALPTRSWLVMAMGYSSFSSNIVACAGRGCAALAGEARDLGPALHQAVVGERLGRPLLALAEGVEAVAEFAGDLGLAAELRDERRRSAFAAGFERADQVMDHLPRGEARVGGRVPVGGQFLGPEQAHLAARRFRSRGCPPRQARRRWCSWPWRASRPRRTRPRRSPTARTTPAPSGCRRRSRLPARPAPRRGSG